MLSMTIFAHEPRDLVGRRIHRAHALDRDVATDALAGCWRYLTGSALKLRFVMARSGSSDPNRHRTAALGRPDPDDVPAFRRANAALRDYEVRSGRPSNAGSEISRLVVHTRPTRFAR